LGLASESSRVIAKTDQVFTPQHFLLTCFRFDDEIYDDFLKSFPEYATPEWDGVVDEDEMKSAKGKERWREFMMRYEKKVNMHASDFAYI
jgi:hypothetical protein